MTTEALKTFNTLTSGLNKNQVELLKKLMEMSGVKTSEDVLNYI